MRLHSGIAVRVEFIGNWLLSCGIVHMHTNLKSVITVGPLGVKRTPLSFAVIHEDNEKINGT